MSDEGETGGIKAALKVEDPTRSEGDMQIVRMIADLARYQFLISPSISGHVRDSAHLRARSAMNFIADKFEGAGWNSPLVKKEQKGLNRQLESALALFSLSEYEGVLPVFTGVSNSYNRFPLFDISNRLAWRSIGIEPSAKTLPGRPSAENFEKLIEVETQTRDRSDGVKLIGAIDAMEGYLELFIDSLRAIGKSRAASSRPKFTVHASPGFSLEYYHQYNYSPQAFGAKLTTPVSASLPISHYCFQGWKQGVLTRDGGVYFAGPGHDEATLRDI